jgi:hypothetical protein
VLEDPFGNSPGTISIADTYMPDDEKLIASYLVECGGKNLNLLPYY